MKITAAPESGHSARAAGDVDRHVAAEIRRHRIAAGLSQSDLARRIGVTWQQVQKYENAENRVSAARLFDIAATLNADIGALFPSAKSAEPAEGANAAPKRASHDSIVLAAAFEGIADPAIRAHILAFVRSLARQAD